MADSSEIQLGTVILAVVRDPDTRAVLDPHPCVVLSKSEEIAAGNDLRVAVCTTSYDLQNLKSGWFPMPAGPPTGFRHPSVVKATWIERVPQSEVIAIWGRARRQEFKQVLNWLADEDRKKLRRSSEPPKKPGVK